MHVIAVPVAPDKVVDWREFAREIMGPRRKEFDGYNARWGLTRHRAFLQQTPDGYVVIGLHEGPGEDRFLTDAVRAREGFDGWFADRISELHGMDFTTGQAPKVELVIDAAAPSVTA